MDMTGKNAGINGRLDHYQHHAQYVVMFGLKFPFATALSLNTDFSGIILRTAHCYKRIGNKRVSKRV